MMTITTHTRDLHKPGEGELTKGAKVVDVLCWDCAALASWAVPWVDTRLKMTTPAGPPEKAPLRVGTTCA
jgi:hypothetical protein